MQLLLELSEMAHLFKQMYSDNVLKLKEQFTRNELTGAIAVELIKREMQQFERKQESLMGEL